jgi:hypothetical protein
LEDLLFAPASQATPETSFSAGDEGHVQEAWAASGQWAKRAEAVIAVLDRDPQSRLRRARSAERRRVHAAARDELPPPPEEDLLGNQIDGQSPSPSTRTPPPAEPASRRQVSKPDLMAISPAPPSAAKSRVRPAVAPMRVVGAARSEPKHEPLQMRPRPQPTIAGLCAAVAILIAGWACASWLWMGVGSVPLAIMSATLGTLGAVITFVLAAAERVHAPPIGGGGEEEEPRVGLLAPRPRCGRRREALTCAPVGMPSYLLTIAYDGGPYHGWQRRRASTPCKRGWRPRSR